MEQTHKTPAPSDMSAIRAAYQLRLKAQADALLEAIETLDKPASFTEITRAARALITVGKLIDMVCRDEAETAPKRKPSAKPAPPPAFTAAISPPRKALTSAHALAAWTPDAAPPINNRRRLPGL